MNTETITISLEEYEELVEDQEMLEALRCCGVDNWDGYSDALELLEEWNEEPNL